MPHIKYHKHMTDIPDVDPTIAGFDLPDAINTSPNGAPIGEFSPPTLGEIKAVIVAIALDIKRTRRFYREVFPNKPAVPVLGRVIRYLGNLESDLVIWQAERTVAEASTPPFDAD